LLAFVELCKNIYWCVLTEKNICHNMSSFNESVALGYLKQAATELVKYACNFLFSFYINVLDTCVIVSSSLYSLVGQYEISN